MAEPNISSDINDLYPQIEDITVSVLIKYYLIGGIEQESRTYTKAKLPQGVIRCRSRVCKHGGVPLEDTFRDMLSEMVNGKLEDDTAFASCKGYEDMGNHNTRDCLITQVEIRIHIKYRELETDKVK